MSILRPAFYEKGDVFIGTFLYIGEKEYLCELDGVLVSVPTSSVYQQDRLT